MNFRPSFHISIYLFSSTTDWIAHFTTTKANFDGNRNKLGQSNRVILLRLALGDTGEATNITGESTNTTGKFSNIMFKSTNIQLNFVMSKWSGPRKILRHRKGSTKWALWGANFLPKY